ncbi:MAG: pyridoxamine 5'-phosphate oxidase family protein [Caldilineaceae bacterium]|nr:pyridoxamine 5'-phosphate oxidase family protein [Caldilineaceae bacterium]
MGKVYEQISEKLAHWIRQQHIFFVSTAPRSDEGLINCSPKGLDTFRILDDHTVAYLDLTGSGVETIAHLKENGRIVVMFCAFEGAPNIVRLHGKGTVVEPTDPAFATLQPLFPTLPGTRAIIRIEVSRVSDSCGFAVPRYAYQEEREALIAYAETKGPAGMVAYRAQKNAQSIDGLPGLTPQEVLA